MQRTEKIIEIYAPVARVFDLFSDFESFPRWMSHIKEVRYTGRRYTRWTAEAPLGSSVEWEAETIVFEPDRRIVWRSVRGDVLTEGEVVFQKTARSTTLMRVRLGYDPPSGRIGALVARLFGTNPEEQLEEDLERFAEVAEGPRRSSSNNNSRRAGVAPRRSFDDEERYGRRVGRTETASRAYGYDEEHRMARDERRGPADERRLYEGQMRERGATRRVEDDRHHAPPPGRYAMTPREREMEETRRRRPDFDYRRKAFSRGVDKLTDDEDAASRRWRR